VAESSDYQLYGSHNPWILDVLPIQGSVIEVGELLL
jgi:hypothetical protein